MSNVLFVLREFERREKRKECGIVNGRKRKRNNEYKGR